VATSPTHNWRIFMVTVTEDEKFYAPDSKIRTYLADDTNKKNVRDFATHYNADYLAYLNSLELKLSAERGTPVHLDPNDPKNMARFWYSEGLNADGTVKDGFDAKVQAMFAGTSPDIALPRGVVIVNQSIGHGTASRRDFNYIYIPQNGTTNPRFVAIRENGELYVNIDGITGGSSKTCKVHRATTVIDPASGRELIQLEVSHDGVRKNVTLDIPAAGNRKLIDTLNDLANGRHVDTTTVRNVNLPAIENPKFDPALNPPTPTPTTTLPDLGEGAVSTTKKSVQALEDHTITLGSATIEGLSQKLDTTGLGYAAGNEQLITIYTEKGLTGVAGTPLEKALAVVTHDSYATPPIILTTDGTNKSLKISQEAFDKFKESNPDFDLGGITPGADGYYSIDVDKAKITENGNICLGISGSDCAVLVTAQGIQYKDASGKTALIVENDKPFNLALSNTLIESACKEVDGCSIKTTPGKFLSDNPIYSSMFDTLIEAKRREANAETPPRDKDIVELKMGPVTLYSVPIVEPDGSKHYVRFRKETITKTLPDGSVTTEDQLFVSMHTTTAREGGRKTVPLAYRVSEMVIEKDADGKYALVMGCSTASTRARDIRYVKMPFSRAITHPGLNRFLYGKVDGTTVDPELASLIGSSFTAAETSLAGRGAAPIDGVARYAGRNIYPTNTRASATILSYDGVGIWSRSGESISIPSATTPPPPPGDVVDPIPDLTRHTGDRSYTIDPHTPAEPRPPRTEHTRPERTPYTPPARPEYEDLDTSEIKSPKINWKSDEEKKKKAEKEAAKKKHESTKKWMIGFFALTTFLSILIPFMVIPSLIFAGAAIVMEIKPWDVKKEKTKKEKKPVKSENQKERERRVKTFEKSKEKLNFLTNEKNRILAEINKINSDTSLTPAEKTQKINKLKVAGFANLTDDVLNKIQEINNDPNLSDAEKRKALEKLKTKGINALNYLTTLEDLLEDEKLKYTKASISVLSQDKERELNFANDTLKSKTETLKSALAAKTRLKQELKDEKTALNKKRDNAIIDAEVTSKQAKIDALPDDEKTTLATIIAKAKSGSSLSDAEKEFLTRMKSTRRSPLIKLATKLLDRNEANNRFDLVTSQISELTTEIAEDTADIQTIENVTTESASLHSRLMKIDSRLAELADRKAVYDDAVASGKTLTAEETAELARLVGEQATLTAERASKESALTTTLGRVGTLKERNKTVVEATITERATIMSDIRSTTPEVFNFEDGLEEYTLTDDERDMSDRISAYDAEHGIAARRKRVARDVKRER